MNYLKIIFYGFLAFAQKYPFFTLAFLAAVILPPIFFPAVRWFMLGMLAIIMIVVGLIWFQFYRLKRQMEKQYRDAMNGNNAGNNAGNAGAGFTGYGFANGMRLEDFVRQMQEQADARQAATQPKPKSDTASKTQKQSADQGEYVDFEEIK
jgi:type IV secretory pathway VirB6-like protein